MLLLAIPAAVLAAVAVVFWPTFSAMVGIWGQSDTFSYGYLVLPMAFWSLWQSARRIGTVAWKPSWIGFVIVLPAAMAWYMGEVVGVQALAQYGMMALFVAACWAILGNSIARRLRFGLGFTLFAVPIGEFMIPALMDVTADFTVAAVHLTGIPVYRTERFFTLPSGSFEVVEACSGIRFLMVTIVLATWYAQQTYTSLRRRLAFIGMAAILMNVANGIRAFIIVLLVHFSEGRIAVGYDHIVYGWVVFVVGLVLIVRLGGLFRDEAPGNLPLGGEVNLVQSARVSAMAVGLLATLVVLRAGETTLSRAQQSSEMAALLAPAAVLGWSGPSATLIDFAPDFVFAEQVAAARYFGQSGEVELHQFKYAPESEIIRYENRLFNPEQWRLIEKGAQVVSTDSVGEIELSRQIIERDGERLIVLSWFDIGGRATASRIEAKLFSALRRVVGGQPSDIMFAVVARSDDSHDDSGLLRFVQDHYDALRYCTRGEADAAQCTGAQTAQASR